MTWSNQGTYVDEVKGTARLGAKTDPRVVEENQQRVTRCKLSLLRGRRVAEGQPGPSWVFKDLNQLASNK